MNNNIIISSAGTSGVCENWNNTTNNNNNSSSMVSFVGGLRSSSYKQQFSDTSNNSHNSNISVSLQEKTYITSGFSSCDNHPSSSIFDFSSLSTSLISSPSNFLTSGIGNYHHHHHVGSSSQFLDYPSTDFLKKEGHDDQSFMSSTSSISSSYLGGGNGGRIGLNLGHRTYFSSRETALIDRLFRRPRGFYQGNQVPRCQAEGCKMDLTNAKHYHRRHKVCELHSKATKVVAGGLEQRFCQQCSRFHVLAEFDQAKRSCRKRLADHNRRRRKTQPAASLSVTTPTAAISVKIAENAFPQAGPSASTSRPSDLLKQPSMSASTTTNNITVTSTSTSASTAALSLAGNHHHHHPMFQSPTHFHHQDHLVIRRPFTIFNNQQDLFVDRDSCRNNIAGNYHGNNSTLLNDEETGSDQLTGGGGGGRSEINQHPDELQKLLHLRQTMYEVELL